MKQRTSTEWIADALTLEPPRSKSLVMTVMGDTIAPHGGAAWLGSLIELLAPLGVTDRLVRTSVFRLVQEGWLTASREGRRSRYGFDPQSLPRFQRADRRIYAPPGLHWDGRWTLVVAQVGKNGSIDSDLRTALRKELEWEGFAMLGPGVLAHPAADPDALLDALHRTGAAGRVFVLTASGLPDAGSRPLRELALDGWDLTAVARSYVDFIGQFTPLLALLREQAQPAPAHLEPILVGGGKRPVMPGKRGQGARRPHGLPCNDEQRSTRLSGAPAATPAYENRFLAPETAFAIRSLLIHAYRRLQLHDPMLPIELLPDPWPGSDAYEVARAIYLRVYAQAEVHVDAVLKREDASAPAADEAFYQRFGGLRDV